MKQGRGYLNWRRKPRTPRTGEALDLLCMMVDDIVTFVARIRLNIKHNIIYKKPVNTDGSSYFMKNET